MYCKKTSRPIYGHVKFVKKTSDVKFMKATALLHPIPVPQEVLKQVRQNKIRYLTLENIQSDTLSNLIGRN